MKIPQKNKVKKQNSKKKAVIKPKKEHVQIVAHEIKFARLLSGNEKKTRDRALKTLKKWILNCFDKGYEFKEDDFMRIWKGLFYAVWMSDKPLVQEELCENISGILDLFPPQQLRHALLMVKVGLRAMATEWYGIDHHRMDKCLMLVRRYLRGSLRCVARAGWSEEACKMYADMLSGSDGIMAPKTPMYARNAVSMVLHVIDCYLEEISKVSEGSIPPLRLIDLLRPFCQYMCFGCEPVLCAASRRMLTELVRQSNQGLEYQGKTKAWEQMGCPEGGPDALQEISDDDDDDKETGDDNQLDDEDKPLDPRAGRVSVALTPLPVPARELAALLTALRPAVAGRARTRLNLTIQRFKKLAEDEYPLKVEEVKRDEGPKMPPPTQLARSLQSLEKQLMATSDELALRGLSRKHRKRLLAKTRAGISIVDDPLVRKRNNAAGDWLVEETTEETKKSKKPKQNSSNKENFDRKVKKRKIEAEKTDGFNKKRKIDEKAERSPSKKKQKTNEPKLTTPKTTKLPTQKPEPKEKPKKSKPDAAQTKPTTESKSILKNTKSTTVVSKKVKNFQKQLSPKENVSMHSTPKRVKFVLKNNSMQETTDYYKSVRQSPSIPFDSSKAPSKTNLKPSTPSPINPFFKKKWKLH